MSTGSRKYTDITTVAQNTANKTIGILLFVFFTGLAASGCATVDATVNKVKTGVADRFGKDDETDSGTLQAVEGVPETQPESAETATKPLLVEVQEKLRALSYYSGPISGSLDSKTEAAIQDFQLDHDMRINGRASRSLLRELDKVLDQI